MKMYVKKWKFGGDRSRNKIWTKNSLSGHVDFLPSLDKISHVSRFGRYLEAIWNIHMLDIRTFEQIDESGQSPILSDNVLARARKSDVFLFLSSQKRYHRSSG
jgi:hypothetical protein